MTIIIRKSSSGPKKEGDKLFFKSLINKKSNNKQGFKLAPQEYKAILQEMCDKFPKLFCSGKIKLLKIDILNDLEKRLSLSKTKIRRFLVIYTRKRNYLNKFKLGAPRFDLEGEILYRITEEDLKAHRKELTKRSIKRKKKKELLEKNNRTDAPLKSAPGRPVLSLKKI